MPISRPARTTGAAPVTEQTTNLYSSAAHGNGFEAAAVVKDTAGVFYGFAAYNKGAAERFVMVFDAAAAPASGALPDSTVLNLPIAATSDKGYGISEGGLRFENGIVIALSTSAQTYEPAGEDAFFSVEYK